MTYWQVGLAQHAVALYFRYAVVLLYFGYAAVILNFDYTLK